MRCRAGDGQGYGRRVIEHHSYARRYFTESLSARPRAPTPAPSQTAPSRRSCNWHYWTWGARTHSASNATGADRRSTDELGFVAAAHWREEGNITMASKMSRRQALGLLGGAASIGILAACSQPTPPPAVGGAATPAAAKPAQAPGPSPGSTGGAGLRAALRGLRQRRPRTPGVGLPLPHSPAAGGAAAAAKPAATGSGSTKPVNVAVRATRSPNYALWVETGSVLSTMPYIAMGLALQDAKGAMQPFLASSYDMDATASTMTVKLRPRRSGATVSRDGRRRRLELADVDPGPQVWGKGSPQSLFFPFARGEGVQRRATADKILRASRSSIRTRSPSSSIRRTCSGPSAARSEWCILPKARLRPARRWRSFEK